MALFKKAKNLNKTIIGIVGYSVLEGTLDGLISQYAGSIAGLSTDMIQAGLGYFLMGRKGIVGDIGRIMFTINAYTVAKRFLGSGFNLLTPTQTVATNGSW